MFHKYGDGFGFVNLIQSITWSPPCVISLCLIIMFYIFDTIVRPITTYGSDVWGCNIDLHYTNKVFLDFIKCALRVKATTCTTIVYGECGRLPLSVFCHKNVLCFAYRLLTLPAHTLGKVSIFWGRKVAPPGFWNIGVKSSWNGTYIRCAYVW